MPRLGTRPCVGLMHDHAAPGGRDAAAAALVDREREVDLPGRDRGTAPPEEPPAE